MFPARNKGVSKAGIQESTKGEKDVVICRLDEAMTEVEMNGSLLTKLANGDGGGCRG